MIIYTVLPLSFYLLLFRGYVLRVVSLVRLRCSHQCKTCSHRWSPGAHCSYFGNVARTYAHGNVARRRRTTYASSTPCSPDAGYNTQAEQLQSRHEVYTVRHHGINFGALKGWLLQSRHAWTLFLTFFVLRGLYAVTVSHNPTCTPFTRAPTATIARLAPHPRVAQQYA